MFSYFQQRLHLKCLREAFHFYFCDKYNGFILFILQESLLPVICFDWTVAYIASMSIGEFIVSREKENRRRRKTHITTWKKHATCSRRTHKSHGKNQFFKINMKRNHIVGSGFQVLKGLLKTQNIVHCVAVNIDCINAIARAECTSYRLGIGFLRFCTFNNTARCFF